MVNGVLYTTAGTRRSVVALDAATGELLWVAQRERRRARRGMRRGSSRAAASSYWTDGKDDDASSTSRPATGSSRSTRRPARRIPAFGKNGIVDLKDGVVFGKEQQIDLETGEIGLHSTPTVAKDAWSSSARRSLEGGTPKTHNNTKGLVRGFDVRTGKRLWTFNTIPRPGEFGNDTWENDSWADNGNAGVWTQISVDEELGLAYLPVESPTLGLLRRPPARATTCSARASSRRPEDRQAQVALPDRAPPDLGLRHLVGADPAPTSPSTASRSRRSRCRASRRCSTCSTASPASRSGRSRSGRCRSATCRASRRRRRSRSRPSRRPTTARASTVDDLIDFTPELHAEALEDRGALQARTDLHAAARQQDRGAARARCLRSSGGTNWPGGSYDPETHIAYVPSFIAMPRARPPAAAEQGFSDMPYVSGTALTGVRYISGPGENVGADAARSRRRPPRTPAPSPATRRPTAARWPQGLPLLKPPYGRLSARSTWITARSSGRSRTAKRPTACATTRR